MKLQQLDKLWGSLRSFHYQLNVLICLHGELIRGLLGVKAVVFIPVLQDADLLIAFGK